MAFGSVIAHVVLPCAEFHLIERIVSDKRLIAYFAEVPALCRDSDIAPSELSVEWIVLQETIEDRMVLFEVRFERSEVFL
ncbi:hypothetical protein ABE073_00225 [Lederbergia citrisecunda]|uniref:hypothetical protein n=1 Tax=Lederbergia citrisecunda TaxID=2833583 RepID=UPI003D276359